MEGNLQLALICLGAGLSIGLAAIGAGIGRGRAGDRSHVGSFLSPGLQSIRGFSAAGRRAFHNLTGKPDGCASRQSLCATGLRTRKV